MPIQWLALMQRCLSNAAAADEKSRCHLESKALPCCSSYPHHLYPIPQLTDCVYQNWAGDLKLKAARSVIETIRHVFSNCRVFREDKLEDETKNVDFTNMVVFCTKSRAPYTFRQPVEQDYLGTFSRRRYMYPQHEIDLKQYWGESKNDWTVLEESNVHELNAWQKVSAVGHWVVIRTVVPDRVWENY
jgi:hypothetical protein